MRQNIIIGSLIGSGIIILGQFGFFNSLLLFLLVGVVPGTSYAVPSSAMLFITLSLTLLVAGYVTRHYALRP